MSGIDNKMYINMSGESSDRVRSPRRSADRASEYNQEAGQIMLWERMARSLRQRLAVRSSSGSARSKTVTESKCFLGGA